MDTGRPAMHSPIMGDLHGLPGRRDWYVDERDDGRRMQATWHPERGIVVLSLWHRNECTATFQLPIDEADGLIALLGNALGEAARTRSAPRDRAGRSVG
jgi:hypothetical protein